jgi:hypothetical protein
VSATPVRGRISGVLALGACLSFPPACSDSRPDQDLRIIEARPVERLSAALLWQDFQTQRDAAERTYNGNAVTITGEAARAGTDDEGRPYVFFALEGGGIFAYLLNDRTAEVIAALQEESRVSLKCFCDGFDDRHVVLKSCIPET